MNGRDKPVADALSRMDINARNVFPLPIEYVLIAKAQQNDPDLSELYSTSLDLQALPLPQSTDTIVCDMSTASPRPYIPEHLCHFIFHHFHSQDHPGIHATQRVITARCVWPGIN